jgi:hypothetical protein
VAILLMTGAGAGTDKGADKGADNAAATDWTERSFDAATDIAKQVLTLSTAVVTLSITFLTDVASHKSHGATVVLGISWVVFLFSIGFGMLTLMAIAGVQANHFKKTPTIYAPNVILFGCIQLLLFAAGLILTAIAGFSAV